jgi:hypothetical protein
VATKGRSKGTLTSPVSIHRFGVLPALPAWPAYSLQPTAYSLPSAYGRATDRANPFGLKQVPVKATYIHTATFPTWI